MSMSRASGSCGGERVAPSWRGGGAPEASGLGGGGAATASGLGSGEQGPRRNTRGEDVRDVLLRERVFSGSGESLPEPEKEGLLNIGLPPERNGKTSGEAEPSLMGELRSAVKNGMPPESDLGESEPLKAGSRSRFSSGLQPEGLVTAVVEALIGESCGLTLGSLPTLSTGGLTLEVSKGGWKALAASEFEEGDLRSEYRRFGRRSSGARCPYSQAGNAEVSYWRSSAHFSVSAYDIAASCRFRSSLPWESNELRPEPKLEERDRRGALAESTGSGSAGGAIQLALLSMMGAGFWARPLFSSSCTCMHLHGGLGTLLPADGS